MVANAVAPAGQTNRLVDMAVAERAAGVGPITMHDVLKQLAGGSNRGSRSLLRKEGEGLPDANRRGN
jgi:hypothetical protein